MNTRIKFSIKKFFTLTLTTLLLNATNMHANITSNISTLGRANDVSGLNTKLGTPAGASISADILTANTAISAVNAQNIATQGPAFDSLTDSLKAISNNVTSVPLATAAIQTLQATSDQAVDIQGPAFDPLTDSLAAISNNVTNVPLATAAIQTLQATSDQAVDIQGPAFDPLTDSLKAISNNVTSVPLATSSGQTLQATATNLALLGKSGDVSQIYALLSIIMVFLSINPVTQLMNLVAPGGSKPLTTTVTNTGVDGGATATYNAAIATAVASIITAYTKATQTSANTTTAINNTASAITAFNTLNALVVAGTVVITSTYSAAETSNALAELRGTLVYLQKTQAAL